MDPTDETPEAIDLSIRDAVLRVFSCWEYVKLVQFRMNVINHQSAPTYIPKTNWYESSHPKKAKNPKKNCQVYKDGAWHLRHHHSDGRSRSRTRRKKERAKCGKCVELTAVAVSKPHGFDAFFGWLLVFDAESFKLGMGIAIYFAETNEWSTVITRFCKRLWWILLSSYRKLVP